MSRSINAPRAGTVRATLHAVALASALVLTLGAPRVSAQTRAATPAARRIAENVALHMQMTPVPAGTAADTARAAAVAYTLRGAIAKYRDTTTAVADGYRMFAPRIRNQKVYHFSSNWMGVQENFRFDPSKPTSLLYTKKPDGAFELVGAMYVAPKRYTPEQLDERVPLSVARWHKHVNWCLPPRGQAERWLERKDGQPVFGPESPIVSKAACDAVGGVFRDSIFGWMVHANVFAGNDAKSIWGDEHAAHDMHDGMRMDGSGGEP